MAGERSMRGVGERLQRNRESKLLSQSVAPRCYQRRKRQLLTVRWLP